MLRRAVFSDYQRKGLEKRFQIQKYISKPDRKKLAEKLGLKDSQVSYNFFLKKFQNIIIFFLEKRAKKVAKNLSRIVFLLLRSLLLINQSTQFVCTYYILG